MTLGFMFPHEDLPAPPRPERDDVRAPHVPGRYGVCCTPSGSSWGVYERRDGATGMMVRTFADDEDGGKTAREKAIAYAKSRNG